MATEILTQRSDADEAEIVALSSENLKAQAIEEAHALSNCSGRVSVLSRIAIEKIEPLSSDAMEAEALVFAVSAGLREGDLLALKMTYYVEELVRRLTEAESSRG